MKEASQEKQLVYPAVFHQRVIVRKAGFNESDLEKALIGFEIVEPLAPARNSREDKYASFRFSARIDSHDRFLELDSAVRAVPGFVMML